MDRKKINIKEPNKAKDTAANTGAISDPDNQPLSDGLLAKMRPAHEVVPDIVERHSKRGRPAGSNKTRVTLRLDNDVLASVKGSSEKGWQTRINSQLRISLGLSTTQNNTNGYTHSSAYAKRNSATGKFEGLPSRDSNRDKGGRNPKKKSA